MLCLFSAKTVVVDMFKSRFSVLKQNYKIISTVGNNRNMQDTKSVFGGTVTFTSWQTECAQFDSFVLYIQFLLI